MVRHPARKVQGDLIASGLDKVETGMLLQAPDGRGFDVRVNLPTCFGLVPSFVYLVAGTSSELWFL